MDSRISRREFAKLVARGGLLALLGYCVVRTFRSKGNPGSLNAQCPYPDKNCLDCSVSKQCRINMLNRGKDS